MLIIAGTAPLLDAESLSRRATRPTRIVEGLHVDKDLATLDANDLLYQVDASRNYDPSAKLSTRSRRR